MDGQQKDSMRLFYMNLYLEFKRIWNERERERERTNNATWSFIVLAHLFA